MKHTEVILEVSNKTNVGVEECDSIIKAFEKFAEGNMFHSSKNNYDHIAISLSETTGISEGKCKEVLNAFNATIGQGLKDKLTFKKRS